VYFLKFAYQTCDEKSFLVKLVYICLNVPAVRSVWILFRAISVRKLCPVPNHGVVTVKYFAPRNAWIQDVLLKWLQIWKKNRNNQRQISKCVQAIATQVDCANFLKKSGTWIKKAFCTVKKTKTPYSKTT